MSKLAINGGTPAFKGTFPDWPIWGEEEKENLIRAFEAGQWGTLGAEALTFAEEFAQYIGVKHTVCVNTGTQALEMMLKGVGIGYGDDVITTPYTFAATVSAIAYSGAMPVMADVDADTGCIDPNSIEERITPNTKAILLIHVGGRPCDMDAVNAIAKKHGIFVLEDSAHAHGSQWKGKRCGSLGDASAFSFQGSKAITGGEGGAITTDNEDIFNKVWEYHHSGRAADGETVMGTNARMAEWEAAVLRAQLKRLESQTIKRHKNAAYLTERLSKTNVKVSSLDERITLWNGYLYNFRTNKRAEFIEALNAEGVPCGSGYPSLEDTGMLYEPYFEKCTGRKYQKAENLKGLDILTREAIWLPSNLLLAEEDSMEQVADAIIKVAEEIY